MSVVLEIRRRGRHIAGSILGALIFAYFVMHAVQGDRGLLAWLQIRQQIASADIDYSASKLQRAGWERRVVLLRSDAMNRDMLDERVRVVTGFLKNDEILVFSEDSNPTR
ncbi:MAG: septum formation initiator family protein [Alphaproteobacteria bacterium]|nr:septum formation initiator family protein [Alphaproteobacteria bacterium]